jgi:hypothetical protein
MERWDIRKQIKKGRERDEGVGKDIKKITFMSLSTTRKRGVLPATVIKRGDFILVGYLW